MPAPPRRGGPGLSELLLRNPALAGCWRERRLAAGEVLFRQGEPADALYRVTAGSLEVFTTTPDGQRMALEQLESGQVFGELGLIDGGHRLASVVALTDATIQTLDGQDFERHVWSSPELAGAAAALVGERIRRTNAYLTLVATWARQVADGHYAEARAAVQHAAADPGDPNIGHFLGTFLAMIDSVSAREASLADALDRLRIEIDDEARASQVAAIADTDFFAGLQDKATALRRRHQGREP
jgi:CRP-like cAMP-binding protein